MLKDKRVIIIFGSPRKNGNTHIMVEEACRGLRESRIDYSIFYLNEMKIQGCQACYYCKRNNTDRCILNDDMQKISADIKAADGILIASPIYFGGVTAQTKLWLDRMFPFINMKVESLLAGGKKAGFIFTQNQPLAELFTGNINSFIKMVEHIGFEVKDSLVACDLDKGYKPMVSENNQIMRKAYALGKNLLS